jgi:hypothetical protein
MENEYHSCGSRGGGKCYGKCGLPKMSLFLKSEGSKMCVRLQSLTTDVISIVVKITKSLAGKVGHRRKFSPCLVGGHAIQLIIVRRVVNHT